MRDTIEWKYTKGETDDEIVKCIEKILDIKFPEDFLECVKKYPNTQPSPNFFKTGKQTWVYGKDGGGLFKSLYSFDPNIEYFILREYHGINFHSGGDNKVPDGIIPFASSSNNQDSLCFDYRKGFPPTVVFFDLQFHWDYLDYLEEPEFCKEVKEEDYLIYICDSFGELLDMLEEEPEENY